MVTEHDSGQRPERKLRGRRQDLGRWPKWPGPDPRPDRAHASAVVVLAVLLLLVMFAVLCVVLFLMHAFANTP